MYRSRRSRSLKSGDRELDHRRNGLTGDMAFVTAQDATRSITAPWALRARATGRVCGDVLIECGAEGGRIKPRSASPDVRFEAHCGLKSDIAPCPFCAISDHSSAQN